MGVRFKNVVSRLFVLIFFSLLSVVTWGSPPAHAAGTDVVPLGSEFGIAVDASHGQIGMSAAFDGTNYLVGLMYYDLNGTVCGDDYCRYARAQFVDQTGQLVGSQINVAPAGGAPQVGFDGSSYLMIYETGLQGQETTGDIYGVSISTAGVAGTPFLITDGARRQELNIRNMAFDGTNGRFLVVWEDQREGTDLPNGFNPRIYGRLVSSNGNVAAEFRINSKKGQVPTVAFDGTRYLVVWTDESKIWGQFVTAAGTLSGTAFVIDPVSKTYADPSNMPLIVGFDSTRYVVSYGEKISTADCASGQGPYLQAAQKGLRRPSIRGRARWGVSSPQVTGSHTWPRAVRHRRADHPSWQRGISTETSTLWAMPG